MFNYKASLQGNSHPVLRKVVIYGSQTIAVGQVVESYTNGYVVDGVIARPLLGFVHAIVDRFGHSLKPETDAMAETTGNTLATGPTGTVTVAATNHSASTAGKQIAAIVDVSLDTIYSVGADATPGTTTGSDLIGVAFDMLTGDPTQLDESTGSLARTSPAQFHSWGVDPEDSSRVLVSLMESQRIGGGTYS